MIWIEENNFANGLYTFSEEHPPEQSLSPCIYNYANKNVVKKKSDSGDFKT